MKKLTDTMALFLLCCGIALFCCCSETAKEGALNGIALCEGTVIPALLPLLILCTLIQKSRACRVTERLLGGLTEKALRLPRCASTAILFGLIGGYPTGAVLTCQLYEQRRLTEAQARRIMRFNVCGGIAFEVSAVGSGVYGSAAVGAMLLSSHIGAALLILLFGAIHQPEIITKPEERTGLPFGEALPAATEAAVRALAVMSAYIVAFSALCGALSLPRMMNPLLEITSGVCGGEPLTLPYCAFFLAFGGLCLHLQLLGFLKKMKIPYADFLVFRMLASLLSFGITAILCRLFPQETTVFAPLSVPHAVSSDSAAFSTVMLIGCAVVIFDIENRKLKLR